eukprot:5931803-Amphidinium_carterae.1
MVVMPDVANWNSCLEQIEGCSSHAFVTARHDKRQGVLTRSKLTTQTHGIEKSDTLVTWTI